MWEDNVLFKAKSQQIEVNLEDKAALLRAVSERFSSKQGFALATINLDHLVKLRTSERFAKAYAEHDFVVADGNPVVWLSKLAKRPVSLVPGSDMVVPLARAAAEAGTSIALFGATESSLQAAAAALKKQIPSLDVATAIAPPMGFDASSDAAAEMLGKLESSGAGLVFLALTAPKQEEFAARGRKLAPTLGFASIGAGLDFLSGEQRRAPKWARALALEWAWRMLSSPARLGPRYIRCLAILPSLVLEAAALRKH
ncbi:WecB/TagA/CpsF family glycosyltransferase [Lentibacter algarum]|uniref:WecB/TagA/CpsF family glycosyltransferase n=1 Tax=Lentibacter algarum TaxID=576131 RepID=UPI001C0976EE|nr:WecB/TagA/CpsF family glycosyltransferase [Lentibacter algarum]MBU2983336.1 WecB/TagA/CpsF family glycosyltransferase [Lentibacter algarum]